MMESRGTVKEFKDTLDEMKKVYNYNDERTYMEIGHNAYSFSNCVLNLMTTDEVTGVEIIMKKDVRKQDE